MADSPARSGECIYGGISLSHGNASNIGWFAHVGGFLFGVVFALTCKVPIQRPRAEPG